jgi:hypothetical protein
LKYIKEASEERRKKTRSCFQFPATWRLRDSFDFWTFSRAHQREAGARVGWWCFGLRVCVRRDSFTEKASRSPTGGGRRRRREKSSKVEVASLPIFYVENKSRRGEAERNNHTQNQPAYLSTGDFSTSSSLGALFGLLWLLLPLLSSVCCSIEAPLARFFLLARRVELYIRSETRERKAIRRRRRKEKKLPEPEKKEPYESYKPKVRNINLVIITIRTEAFRS